MTVCMCMSGEAKDLCRLFEATDRYHHCKQRCRTTNNRTNKKEKRRKKKPVVGEERERRTHSHTHTRTHVHTHIQRERGREGGRERGRAKVQVALSPAARHNVRNQTHARTRPAPCHLSTVSTSTALQTQSGPTQSALRWTPSPRWRKDAE